MTETLLEVYPEPTPVRTFSDTENERFLDGLKRFPVYPDDCVIASPGFAYDQSIHYRSADVDSDVEWAQEVTELEPDFEDFLVKLIERIQKVYPGDTDKWNSEFVGKGIDATSTLKEVSEAEAANCFIRSVAFVGVLQGLGVEAKIIQGDWVETTRERVLGEYAVGADPEYRDVGSSFGAGVRFLKGEQGEFHAFALVRAQDKLYLADPALWVKHEDGTPNYPLVKEVTEEELLNRDIVFELPNGKKRHYVFRGGRVVIETPQQNRAALV